MEESDGEWKRSWQSFEKDGDKNTDIAEALAPTICEAQDVALLVQSFLGFSEQLKITFISQQI